jgi:hypothetical protein
MEPRTVAILDKVTRKVTAVFELDAFVDYPLIDGQAIIDPAPKEVKVGDTAPHDV